MGISCSACGFENPDGMRFCGNCGTRLESSPTRPAPAPPPSMMGPGLDDRLKQAGLEARGQRRNVTVLFADISGFTTLSTRTDSEDLYEVIRQFVQVLGESVYRFEGVVDKFTGDGLMALFGAPIAHENNAELAVLCAIDMFRQIERIREDVIERIGAPLRVRIGLNSGSVTVGGIGSNELMNYTAIGDTVNLAQRLEDAAEPGTLMVSQSVYSATRRLFDYDAVPDLNLKGYSEPVTGYRFVRVKPKPQSVRGLEGLQAPMIGRDHELSRLLRSLESLLHRRRGQLAVVLGEGGIGKSRLAAELKQIARQYSVIVLEGTSLTYRRNVAYWIFQDMLRNNLGVTTETPMEEVSQALKRSCETLLRVRTAETLPFLEHLLGLPPSNPAQAQRLNLLDAGQLRQQVFLAMRTWLVAQTAHQAVLLILDDLHWADDISIELLNYLLPLLLHQPIYMVTISRPVEEGPLKQVIEWARVNIAGSSTHINLLNLSPSESQTLLTRLIQLRNPPESLVDRIIQQSAGIPFYLEEILRMLIDQGTLVEKGDEWEISEKINPDDIGVPSTLEALILARFDRLPPLSRRVLQVSSVIGRQFKHPVLAAVLRREAEKIPATLEKLVEQGYIVLETDLPTPAYAFRNAIVSDAIYRTLLKRDRLDLHTQVGEAIEKVYQGQLENQVEILARHFTWGKKNARALPYVIQAAHKAERSYFNQQARSYFLEALDIMKVVDHSLVQEAEVINSLGHVLLLIGDYPIARERFEQAIRLLEAQPDSQERISALHRGVATTYERQGDYAQALNHLSAAQDCVPETAVIEKALILNDIGWIHFRRGEIDTAQKILRQALEISEKTPRIDVTASILNRLGGAAWQMGVLNLASEFVQRSLTLRQEIGDTVALARSYNNLGLLKWLQGQWDAALENLARCLELNGSLGDIEGVIMAHANLGLVQMERGELEGAGFHLGEALCEAEAIGHTYNIANSCQNFCQLYNLSGEWEKALSFGERSIQGYEELGARQELATVHTLMGRAALGLGRVSDAETWAQRAQELQIAIAEESPRADTDTHGRYLRLLGMIHAQRAEMSAAREALEESSAVFNRLGNRIEFARSLVILARLDKLAGNAQRAGDLRKKARQIFTQFGAALDLARLQEEE